ncbi:hypothetical protein EW145_g3418 [Phellinidium pouzarii]|uniref:RING-type domain-containing protein n=1 Tax=Phellinidium pouzarii TaxID=167371 RepID=A0A4S4L931_9AGAM|nr:hypothetical protein EW145_g3418 [Phellinidium pouzarii]
MSTTSDLSSLSSIETDGRSTPSTSTERAADNGDGDISDPLLAPTTLATHARGLRLLRNSRSESRSARGSRAGSSHGSSRQPSRHSSVAREPLTSWAVDVHNEIRGLREEDVSCDLRRPGSVKLDAGAETAGPSGFRGESISAGTARVSHLAVSELAAPRGTRRPTKETSRPRPAKKRLRAYNVLDEKPNPSKRTRSRRESDVEIILLPGETSNSSIPVDSTSTLPSPPVIAATAPAPAPAPAPTATSMLPHSGLLSAYSCPICFSPPLNPTLTPCGHVCCGECLFTAVRAALSRIQTMMMMREAPVPRCPVCRAILKDWDGRGGGVIALKPRIVISI